MIPGLEHGWQVHALVCEATARHVVVSTLVHELCALNMGVIVNSLPDVTVTSCNRAVKDATRSLVLETGYTSWQRCEAHPLRLDEGYASRPISVVDKVPGGVKRAWCDEEAHMLPGWMRGEWVWCAMRLEQ